MAMLPMAARSEALTSVALYGGERNGRGSDTVADCRLDSDHQRRFDWAICRDSRREMFPDDSLGCEDRGRDGNPCKQMMHPQARHFTAQAASVAAHCSRV
jgi:hypothetical protein